MLLPAASAAASGCRAARAQEPEVSAEGFPPGNASSSSDPGFSRALPAPGTLTGPRESKLGTAEVAGGSLTASGPPLAEPARRPAAGGRSPFPQQRAAFHQAPRREGPPRRREGPLRRRWALLGGYGLSLAAVGPPQQQWPLLGGDGPSSAADEASLVAMGPLGGRKGLPRRREGCGYPRWFTNCWTRLIVLRQR